MNQSADKNSPAVVDAAVKKPKEFEIRSDAWERFRTAVHVMTKAGPQHRIGGSAVKSGPKERPASKGRVHKGKSRA